jgi:acetylornithine/succinyldiaminopimelate/putrescine aminotransferase
MEEIFFSGTFGGELLSLAAANTVLSMHQQDEVSPALAENGSLLSRELSRVIDESGMGQFLTIKGHDTWKFLHWEEGHDLSILELKTFFMQEMFKRGVLVLGTHNVTLAHDKRIQRVLVDVYEQVLTLMHHQIISGTLKSNLEVEPLQPLFKVR